MNLFERHEGNRDGCVAYEQDLLLYLHDAVTPSTRRRVENHIKGCRACRERLNAFAGASEMLAFAVRGGDSPTWAPPRAVRSIWRRELPWYTPLIVALFIGGMAVSWFSIGAAIGRNGRAEAATNGISMKPGPQAPCTSCHNSPSDCASEGEDLKMPSSRIRHLKIKAPILQ